MKDVPANAVSNPKRDPVCGMMVAPGKNINSDYQGIHYAFCSAKCKAKFDLEPERYLQPAQGVASAQPEPGTIYTCPMHPEIRQSTPGSCPKCGMALEPLLPSLEDEGSPELTDFPAASGGRYP